VNSISESPNSAFSEADLRRRRLEIRGRLTRANTAGVGLLLIVIALSLAAISQGYRAERKARDAAAARTQAEEELWKSRLHQAQAARVSGLAGRKQDSLEALAAAAADRPSPELRDEAIAAFALTDITGSELWRSTINFIGLAPTFAPDLDHYATGDTQGVVTVFRTSTGETLSRFQGPMSPITTLRFSPDDHLLAVAFQNGEVIVWSLTNERAVVTWTCGQTEAHGTSLDFSPDGRVLAVACGTSSVRFLDLVAGRELSPLKLEAAADRVRFRPDGGMLAVGVSNRIELRHWPEPMVAQTLPHPGDIVTFAWHPDNRRLASSCWGTSDILLWDTVTTNHLALRGHAELVPHLAFNHRGDLLISFSWDGSTRFWNGDSGESLFVSRAGFGTFFSRDNTRLAYFRENQGFGLWKVSSSSTYRELTLPPGSVGYVTGFDFSPDGRLLAIVNREGLRLFDPLIVRELSFAPARNNRSVSFSADGTELVTVATDQISLWRIQQLGEAEWRLEWQRDLLRGAPLDGGSVTRGTPPWLAVPSIEQVFCVDLSQPRPPWSLPGEGAMGPLTCAAVSPDTNWVATSYWKGNGTFAWDTRTRRMVHNLGPAGGFVAFSPDNRWLLVGSAHEYSLWETKNWRLVREFERRSAGELVGRGAFSPDSRLMAICPEVNQTQLIETESGRRLAALNAPTPKNIGWVAFSPDGQTLAASTFDNQIQLWDLRATRQQLAALNLDWSDDNRSVMQSSAMNRDVPSSVPSRQNLPPAMAPSTGRLPILHSAPAFFYLLAGFGAVLAVVIGLYTLRYHQKMMNSYVEIENVVARRNRELEVTHAELFHSQKMKALGTLAAGIAHDFNNLLSVIRMGNNLLQRPGVSPDDKAESSAAIERAVEQGKKVVRSMLGYSRERPEERASYSVVELVEEVVLLLSKPFLSGVTLTLELNRNIPPVTGARGRLEQILLNLIVNASESMSGSGRLRIAARVAESANGEFVLRPRAASRYVELEVADSGSGIDLETQDRIFEPFFSTKSRGASSGAGLGLTMVHSLAQAEGMGIQLRSDPGRGAVFTIVIPADRDGVADETGKGSTLVLACEPATDRAGVRQMHIGNSTNPSTMN
jgi:signal transduction histidine kinase